MEFLFLQTLFLNGHIKQNKRKENKNTINPQNFYNNFCILRLINFSKKLMIHETDILIINCI